MATDRQGPLAGVRVIEIASIGPGPFAVMMLADMGADVIRLERPGGGGGVGMGSWNDTHRGRPSVACDLKNEAARGMVLKLAGSADALIEGFRPGVMEKLGLGPDELLAASPALVYGRMTGYGQDGPMASVAGHDINYISVAGALGQFKRSGEKPLFPLNMVGDYGGGAMLLAFGVLAGILEARGSGQGQVVDAAMVEGSALLMTMIHSFNSMGMWGEPGTNLLDSGAHFYETYETSDGGFMAVGAIEPQFYAELLRLLELEPDDFPQMDQARWPEFKDSFAEIFRTKTRDQWAQIFESAEACTTAIYGMADAPAHPHNKARGTFIEVGGRTQPAPAPRFSRTPPATPTLPSEPGADTDAALADWGISEADVATLRASGALG